MMVHVNGEPLELEDDTTLRGLIERLGLGRGPVAVERNGEVVPRVEHPATRLREGDTLEIVHLVGGG